MKIAEITSPPIALIHNLYGAILGGAMSRLVYYTV